MWGRFLPAYCPGFVQVLADTGMEQKSKEVRDGERKSKGLRLELPYWLIAWDSYALASAALDQVQ